MVFRKAVEDLNFTAVVPAYFHIVPLGEIVLNGKDHGSFAPIDHRLLGHHDGIALGGMDHRPGVHAGEEPAAAGEPEGDLYQPVLVHFGVDGGDRAGYTARITRDGKDLRLLSGDRKSVV